MTPRQTLGSMLIAAALVALPAGSFAADHSADDEAACTPDVFRLCATDIPSEARIVACLNRKMASLSPACRRVMQRPDPAEGRQAHRNRN